MKYFWVCEIKLIKQNEIKKFLFIKIPEQISERKLIHNSGNLQSKHGTLILSIARKLSFVPNIKFTQQKYL